MGADFIGSNRYIKFSCFFILFFIQSIFIWFLANSIFVNIGLVLCSIVIAFYIYIHQKNFLKSINTAFSILLIFNATVTIIAGLISFIFPSIFELYNPIFNVVMQILIISIAVTIRKKKEYFLISSDIKSILIFYLILKAILVFMLSFGLPIIMIHFNEIYMYFMFAVALFLVVSIFLVKHLLTLENENKRMEIELTERYVEAKNFNKRYYEIVEFKHYVVALYKSAVSHIDAEDMHGWKKYFTKYIEPIHERLDKEVGEYKQIEHIRIELIKSRIIQLINTVSRLPNVSLYININNEINHIVMGDIDLFTILNIYIDNAVEETEKQENGEIIIDMTQTHLGFSFKIRNSLVDNKSMPKPHNTHKGFNIIMDIIKKYGDKALISLRRENGMFLQALRVQNN